MAERSDEPRQLPIIDERQLELFKQFVSVQKDELDLKAKELVLREKELVVEEGSLQRNHDYALKALEAQTKDRDADRGFRQKAIFWSFMFGGFLTVLLAAFCSYALYLGKIDMVRDIMLQIFGTGGLGAALFFAARSIYKGPKQREDE
jgi:hypothetical protein